MKGIRFLFILLVAGFLILAGCTNPFAGSDDAGDSQLVSISFQLPESLSRAPFSTDTEVTNVLVDVIETANGSLIAQVLLQPSGTTWTGQVFIPSERYGLTGFEAKASYGGGSIIYAGYSEHMIPGTSSVAIAMIQNEVSIPWYEEPAPDNAITYEISGLEAYEGMIANVIVVPAGFDMPAYLDEMMWKVLSHEGLNPPEPRLTTGEGSVIEGGSTGWFIQLDPNGSPIGGLAWKPDPTKNHDIAIAINDPEAGGPPRYLLVGNDNGVLATYPGSSSHWIISTAAAVEFDMTFSEAQMFPPYVEGGMEFTINNIPVDYDGLYTGLLAVPATVTSMAEVEFNTQTNIFTSGLPYDYAFAGSTQGWFPHPGLVFHTEDILTDLAWRPEYGSSFGVYIAVCTIVTEPNGSSYPQPIYIGGDAGGYPLVILSAVDNGSGGYLPITVDAQNALFFPTAMPVESDMLEPNNESGTAVEILLATGETYFQQLTLSETDNDWFVFYAAPGVTYVFETREWLGMQVVDTFLDLYNDAALGSGTPLMFSDNNGESPYARLDIMSATGEWLYVNVHASDWTSQGYYELDLHEAP